MDIVRGNKSRDFLPGDKAFDQGFLGKEKERGLKRTK